MSALEEMLQAWRKRPDAELTMPLCSYLGASRDASLIREVGSMAEQRLSGDADVMLAVGRMYLSASLLPEARRALATARRAGARDARPLRYMGEVLLREGEAMRAQKVLQRAIEMGGAPEAQAWLDRASRYVELEQRHGSRAVATEVARSLPRHSGSPSMVEIDADSLEEVSDDVSPSPIAAPPFRAAADARPRMSPMPVLQVGIASSRPPASIDEEDENTHVLPAASLAQYVRRSVDSNPDARDEPTVLDADLLEELDPDDDSTDILAEPGFSSYEELTVPTEHSERASFEDQTVKKVVKVPPRARAPSYEDLSDTDLASVPDILGPTSLGKGKHAAARPARITTPAPPAVEPLKPTRVATLTPPPPSLRLPLPPTPPRPPSRQPQPDLKAALKEPRLPRAEPVYAPPAPRTASPSPDLLEDSIIVVPDSKPAKAMDRVARGQAGAGHVPARDEVIRARRAPTLRLPDRRPPTPQKNPAVVQATTTDVVSRPKRKGSWVVRIVLLGLFVAGGAFGAQRYMQYDQERRAAARAEQQLGSIAGILRASNPEALDRAARELAGVDRRGPLRQPVLRLEMRRRILELIVFGKSRQDLEQVVRDAAAAGVPQKGTAAGEVAIGLAKDNLADAVKTIEKWKVPASQDPYFELVAGKVLEKLGDSSALQHYARAAELDPDFTIARILQARLALLEQGSTVGRPLVEALAKKLGQRAEAATLLGLLWAVNPERADDPPAALPQSGSEARLVAPLRSVVSLVRARQALLNAKPDVARDHIKTALTVADSQFVLAALGSMALELQDNALAREAASKLELLDMDDAKAVAMRAHAALLEGRLREATADIDKMKRAKSASPVSLGIMQAVAAYEKLDLVGLRKALEALETAGASKAELRALALAPRVMSGTDLPPLEELASLLRVGVVWGDLIAMDLALAHGDIKRAEQVIEPWIELDGRPLHLLRVARLRRYQGRVTQAQELCTLAASQAPPTPALLIECALVRQSLPNPGIVKSMSAEGVEVSEPITQWLLALADSAQHGPRSRAAAELALPEDTEPLALRVVAARALVQARDPRAKKWVTALAKALPTHPDLRRAKQGLR